jgi:hypothetical protein
VIRNAQINRLVFDILQVVGWIVMVLTLVRLGQVAWRLGSLARRGRPRLALKVAFSNPVINSYFLFTIFMFYLFVRTNNRFGAQGRNWLPFLLPIFLVAIVYAPKAIGLRSVQRVLSATLAAGLLVYVIYGSHYAIKTVKHRYYVRLDAPPPAVERTLSPPGPQSPAVV